MPYQTPEYLKDFQTDYKFSHISVKAIKTKTKQIMWSSLKAFIGQTILVHSLYFNVSFIHCLQNAPEFRKRYFQKPYKEYLC